MSLYIYDNFITKRAKCQSFLQLLSTEQARVHAQLCGKLKKLPCGVQPPPNCGNTYLQLLRCLLNCQPFLVIQTHSFPLPGGQRFDRRCKKAAVSVKFPRLSASAKSAEIRSKSEMEKVLRFF
jgi:hypothetical protein